MFWNTWTGFSRLRRPRAERVLEAAAAQQRRDEARPARGALPWRAPNNRAAYREGRMGDCLARPVRMVGADRCDPMPGENV